MNQSNVLLMFFQSLEAFSEQGEGQHVHHGPSRKVLTIAARKTRGWQGPAPIPPGARSTSPPSKTAMLRPHGLGAAIAHGGSRGVVTERHLSRRRMHQVRFDEEAVTRVGGTRVNDVKICRHGADVECAASVDIGKSARETPVEGASQTVVAGRGKAHRAAQRAAPLAIPTPTVMSAR